MTKRPFAFALTVLIAGVSLGFAISSRGAEPAQQSLAATPGPACARTIEADIVALDQPIFLNRLGASLPGGMIYALRRDVELLEQQPERRLTPLERSDIRHRQRENVAECCRTQFQIAIVAVDLELIAVAGLDDVKQPRPHLGRSGAGPAGHRRRGGRDHGL